MTGNRVDLWHIPKLIFRSLQVSEIPGFGNSQSCDADFGHVDSSSGFTLIIDAHIHATRVTTLPQKDWVPCLKFYFREISLGNRPFRRWLFPVFEDEPSSETIRMKTVSPTDSFSCKSTSLSFERFYTRPRFETEAQGN